jgi:tetratricopeptide (TPR) repeat protein
MNFIRTLLSELSSLTVSHFLADVLIGVLGVPGAWLLAQTRFSPSVRRAKLHLRRGNALGDAERYTDAQQELDIGIKAVNEPGRSSVLADLYLSRGDIDSKLKQWESAIHFYTLAKEEAIAAKRTDMIDAIYLRLGSACKMCGDLNQAFTWTDQARMLEERTEENPVLGETYARLGEIEMRRNLLDPAISYFLRALPYQERLRDLRAQAFTHSSLGGLYKRKQMDKERRDHYLAAKDLYDEAGGVGEAEDAAQKAI